MIVKPNNVAGKVIFQGYREPLFRHLRENSFNSSFQNEEKIYLWFRISSDLLLVNFWFKIYSRRAIENTKLKIRVLENIFHFTSLKTLVRKIKDIGEF